MLFPEGTTTNGRFLISVRLGAFIPGFPVQPVVVRYPYAHFDQSWGNVHLLKLMFRMFFHNFMEVEYLPVVFPDESKQQNTVQFAEREGCSNCMVELAWVENLFILDSDGNPLPENAAGIGELALHPTMLGASVTFLNADHYNVYFKGMPVCNGKLLRRHGDEFERTAGGYYRAHGRADDTMNLGGIKVSSVEIERICNSVDNAILETAAIGVPPPTGGPEQLVVAVVFKDQNFEENLDKLKLAFNSALQKKLNPLFKVSSVVRVPSLPRTASNKVMRRILRQQFSKHSRF